MRTRLTGLAGIIAAIALLATGCGGASATSGSGGSDPAGAPGPPAGAPPFAPLGTHPPPSPRRPGDTLATVYVNGAKATSALKQAFPSAAPAARTKGKLVWAVADLVAKDEGAKLEVKAKAENVESQVKPYKSELVDEAPAGALLFLS